MDPVKRVRDYLLDNIGHMTRPGNASFDTATQRWFVPICCRTERGDVVVGDVELDRDGHLLYAPSREELLLRLNATKSASRPEPATTIDFSELPKRLAEIVSLAGTEVILTEGHVPRAKLVPLTPAVGRVPGLHSGTIETANDFDAPLPEEFWTGTP